MPIQSLTPSRISISTIQPRNSTKLIRITTTIMLVIMGIITIILLALHLKPLNRMIIVGLYLRMLRTSALLVLLRIKLT